MLRQPHARPVLEELVATLLLHPRGHYRVRYRGCGHRGLSCLHYLQAVIVGRKGMKWYYFCPSYVQGWLASQKGPGWLLKALPDLPGRLTLAIVEDEQGLDVRLVLMPNGRDEQRHGRRISHKDTVCRISMESITFRI